MPGRINVARKGGRPRQRWLDILKECASGATISNMRQDARDRAGWREATMAVARGRMRLDDIIQFNSIQFNSIQYILFASPLCVIVSM